MLRTLPIYTLLPSSQLLFNYMVITAMHTSMYGYVLTWQISTELFVHHLLSSRDQQVVCYVCIFLYDTYMRTYMNILYMYTSFTMYICDCNHIKSSEVHVCVRTYMYIVICTMAMISV